MAVHSQLAQPGARHVCAALLLLPLLPPPSCQHAAGPGGRVPLHELQRPNAMAGPGQGPPPSGVSLQGTLCCSAQPPAAAARTLITSTALRGGGVGPFSACTWCWAHGVSRPLPTTSEAMGHEVPAAQGSTPGVAPQFMGPKVQPRQGSGSLKKHTAPHMHHHNHLRQQHLVHACRRPQATYRAGLWRVSAHIARSAAVSCYGGCAPAGRGSKQQSPGRHATC